MKRIAHHQLFRPIFFDQAAQQDLVALALPEEQVATFLLETLPVELRVIAGAILQTLETTKSRSRLSFLLQRSVHESYWLFTVTSMSPR